MKGYEPKAERFRQRRQQLEREAPSQRGMGDLAAEFRDVTEGFETMHKRIPDPIMDTEAERAGLDRIDDRAQEGARKAEQPLSKAADRFALMPDSDSDPGGVDLDLEVPEPDLDIGGDL